MELARATPRPGQVENAGETRDIPGGGNATPNSQRDVSPDALGFPLALFSPRVFSPTNPFRLPPAPFAKETRVPRVCTHTRTHTERRACLQENERY